jgi:hypothetical protein
MEREESVDLFRLIRRLYPDPLIGLRGAARFDPADVDVLGFLLMHCEHALAAMEAMGTRLTGLCDSDRPRRRQRVNSALRASGALLLQ